jgi:putative spermidine/putrescine transport system permease protein
MLRASSRWQKIAMALLSLPVWTSVLVRAYAWMVLLGRNGIVNGLLISLGITTTPIQLLYTRTAVLIGLVHLLLPYSVFPLLGVMRRIDDRLMAAGESLGARRWSSFFLIFFPLTLPGLGSGCIIVFILSIGYFVTPALLGGLGDTTYVILIEQQVDSLSNWGVAATMSVVLLLITLAIVVAFGRSVGIMRGSADAGNGSRQGTAPRSVRLVMNAVWLFVRGRAGGSGKPIPASAKLRTSSVGANLAVRIVGWTTILLVVAPILIFFPLSLSGNAYLEFPPTSYSLQWFRNYFDRADWVTATIHSFEIATMVAIVATAVGCATAIGLSRSKFRGSGLYLALLISPSIVPALITAIAMYFEFSHFRLLGSIWGLALAHLAIALPFVVLVILGALQRVDLMPEQAARSLGAGPVRAFVKTTLVLIRSSVIAAAFFAFLVSFDDVVIALFLSGTTAVTLPKRMWDGIRLEIDPTIAAASTLLILMSLALMLIVGFVNARAASRRAGEGGLSMLP